MKRLFTVKKKFPILVTDNAWTKIKAISESQQVNEFIFSASNGGCNGFNYLFEVLSKDNYNKINKHHNISPSIIRKNDIKIHIDPMSEMLLLGTTIDYTNSLFESKFTFIHDKNYATSCGCGISFTPKKL